ncbi:phage major tail protein, TP901-1 family [Gemella sp. 19428wG2_WT2a]|nr:phage major tail protein, TP901-1 family [Gemella sp. 19428wG2_WT2a]TFU57681.1 phage major tail protein, TP901-1 family [Gemella sp. WT2a]
MTNETTTTTQDVSVTTSEIQNAIKAMNGKELLAFFRRYKDRTKEDASRISFMTEHLISMEKESGSTVTVDGTVKSLADGENELELSSIANRVEDSKTLAVWEEMHKWFLDGDLVEFWEVDIESMRINEETQKEEYKVNYFQGYLTSFEMSAAADANVELKYTLAINGNGIWGHWDTLSENQKLAVKGVQYAYHTLSKETDI